MQTPSQLPGVRSSGVLVGDQERDDTCQQLALHFAAGRLTAEELDARVTASMAARTSVDLHLLTIDLPTAPEIRDADHGAAAAPPALRALAEGLALVVTLAAIGCTLLLLLATGMAGEEVMAAAWLAAFGAAVSTAGTLHFGRQWFTVRVRPRSAGR